MRRNRIVDDRLDATFRELPLQVVAAVTEDSEDVKDVRKKFAPQGICGPIPIACTMSFSASSPFAQPTACRTPQKAANARSNVAHSSPSRYQP